MRIFIIPPRNQSNGRIEIELIANKDLKSKESGWGGGWRGGERKNQRKKKERSK